jgi:membrane-associated protease RseP (regulator of RpoE activity)
MNANRMPVVAHRIVRTSARREWPLALAVVCGCILLMPAARAADTDSPPAAVPFQPDDISIGEPIALPFAKPAAPKSDPAASTAAAAPAATPNGWLGMAVAESNVIGRWSIVEVVADGPAATAGIRVGDELRAINGSPLRNADEVAQALTAITAGQQVRLAVARADDVQDLVLAAATRPVATARSPEWQPSSQPSAPATPRAVEPPAAAASVLATPAPSVRSVPSSAVVPPAAPTAVPAAVLPSAAPAIASPFVPRSMPQPLPSAGPAPRGRTALGVRTVPIDADIQARFRLPEPAGAYVVGVVGDLPASKAGIPPGSVIVALGDRPVRSPQDLSQLVASGPVDRPMPLRYVLPGGEGKRAEVVLQSLERPLEQALVGGEPMQATPAPALAPGPAPTVARRPETPTAIDPSEVRREIEQFRDQLDELDRRLERLQKHFAR